MTDNNVIIYSKDEFRHNLKSAINKIDRIFSHEEMSGFIFSVDNTPLVSKSVLTALKVVQGENKLESLILSMIREACYESEKKSALSAEILFLLIKDLLDQRNIKNLDKKNLREQFRKILKICQDASERATISDFKKVLKWNFNSSTRSLILEAVKMAGLEGSIVIDSKDVSYPAIEVLNGFSFECDPDINMLAGTAGHSWKSEDVKVLVIDGVVEKVSEIDRILNYGVENRSPIVIFARGFSYDVISTIVLNQHRGVLNVLCVGVPIEESNPNKLVDIAVVTGSDVVSTLKGELISSIIPEDLPDVSSIKATNGKIVISNSKKRDSLRFHIDRLKKLREEKENDLDYLDERIKSLTGRTVKIILPKKDEATNVLTAERIDIILRTLRSLIGFGKINFKILRGELKKEETFISDITLKKLSRLPVIPSSSIALGARDAKVLSNLLTGIENAVLFN